MCMHQQQGNCSSCIARTRQSGVVRSTCCSHLSYLYPPYPDLQCHCACGRHVCHCPVAGQRRLPVPERQLHPDAQGASNTQDACSAGGCRLPPTAHGSGCMAALATSRGPHLRSLRHPPACIHAHFQASMPLLVYLAGCAFTVEVLHFSTMVNMLVRRHAWLRHIYAYMRMGAC